MQDMRKKFIDDNIKIVESKYEHLTDKERNELMILKNKKELNSHDFNKLKALAESCGVKY